MRTAVLILALQGAVAQQQAFGANGQPAPQPLDAIIMQVFDKSHDGKISTQEVSQTLDAFAAFSGMGQPPQGQGPNEMDLMVAAAKRIAPVLFELLDADSSKSLTAAEVEPIVGVQKAFKSGVLRNLTREVFEAVDTDSDDALSAGELEAAAVEDGPVLDQVVALVHAAFPIRKDAAELKAILLKAAKTLGADKVQGAVKWADADGNGILDRKEVGKAYKTAKDYFLKGAQTLQTMGPMLAMFGGMDMDGGGRGRGGGGRGRGRGR